LETRLEYVTETRLKTLVKSIGSNRKLDLTVGFETQDEYILNEILGKRLNKKCFEEKVGLLGKYDVQLTAYIMLKPDPKMTERDGIDEALKSIDYLQSLSKRTDTKIIIYVNPTYASEGSKLAVKQKEVGYEPPLQESLDFVITEAKKRSITVYTD